jgi:glycosyltransferase involved in cell wall biosynthesis
MSKLLYLSDSPLTVTGYATMTRNISNHLSEKGWEVSVIGHNYLGQTLMPPIKFEDGNEIKFRVLGQGMQPYCQDVIEPTLRREKPDIFMVLLDTFMLFPWALHKDFAPAKTIFYFPSDGGAQLPTNCDQILRKFNHAVAMSKFAKKQVESMYNIPCHYIPHGVDTKVFYPLEPTNREQLRKMWGLQDKFVVGSVARNQGRKMMDRTIKAFAEFCRDKPNAVLLLHTDPEDGAAVSNLSYLIRRYNLDNRVLFTGMKYYKGFDYNQMREVYNLMDVFLLTTSGEGFGVPIIESMACGVPPVVTNYTTTKELIIDNDAGLAIDVVAELTGSWEVERAVCDLDDCAKKLTKLYEDTELRKKCSQNGLEAVKRDYDWEKVMPLWYKLLEDIQNEI